MMNQQGGIYNIKRRACVTCTKAKCKCLPQTDSLCQRCARLGKQCVYLDLPERKRKRKDDDSRVGVLESKIEELTAQLVTLRNGVNSHNDTTSSSTNGTASSTEPSSVTDSVPEGSYGDAEPLDAEEPEPEGYHGREPPTTSVLEGVSDIVDRGFLSIHEAETYVAQFKSRFVWNFPFVVLPPSQTADMLRKQEPLLFLAVIAATIPSAHAIRKLLADEIMQHITSRIVASSERNLGLLRALLVLCAWYRYPSQRGNVQLVLLLDLCVNMVHDLRLHSMRGELTTDQQRALLGTYWATCLPRVIGRPSAMKSNKKIDECYQNMATSKEYPSDRCIRPLILTQSFICSVDDSYKDFTELGADASSQEESFIKLMVGANVRHFESLKATLETELSKCPNSFTNLFRCNMHYINIAIRDLALDDEYISYQSRHSFAHSRSAQSFKTSAFRCSLLWHLLRHTKALINAYIDIPDDELPQVTVFTIAQICASLVILPRSVSALLKLIVRNHPRAGIPDDVLNEAKAVVDEADYLNLVVRLYDRLRLLIVGLSGQDKGLDVAGTLCCHMGVLASWYAPRVKAILGIDLVSKSPLAAMTPPSIAISEIIAANANANAATLMQQAASQNVGGLQSVGEQQQVVGSYADAEDGSYLFSDELWSTVLESFSSFG
ncbi:uncharacterized protein Triagg1_5806 [Trichoderma aggressivum f. europaeum]|uniref:Zn(2)-C6 fungal-type domain-containing protein n=1 Tax=Trichoderma aggressivum f. europaeum TaxID=173218 RepID=A0AAE1IG43_9HYPO|nr:hypothetical protein Triagg1_5806 [Trichoderma aggressivum f. europaeum]